MADAFLSFAGVESGQRVLDVGCGTGIITLALAQRGCTAVGVDASEAYLAGARYRRSHPAIIYEHGDAQSLAHATASFDASVSLLAIDVIPEPEKAEAEMRRVTRPGGAVACGSVTGVIEPTLQAAETTRSSNRPTNDLAAYDLYLRAHAMYLSSARQIPEAVRILEQAIKRDPRYGLALASAAVCCLRLVLDGRSDDPAADRLKGADFARRALEVAGDDPGILASAAQALGYFGEDIGALLALVDRALALNPNYARGWSISGLLRNMAGQPDIAIEHAETALRLSPRARIGWSHGDIGMAHFLTRRFDEAVPKLLLAIHEDPSRPQPYRNLAACYAHMGRLDDAREIVERLRAITPVVIPDASSLRNTEHRELWLSGLRLAAGEAT